MEMNINKEDEDKDENDDDDNVNEDDLEEESEEEGPGLLGKFYADSDDKSNTLPGPRARDSTQFGHILSCMVGKSDYWQLTRAKCNSIPDLPLASGGAMKGFLRMFPEIF